MSLRDFAGRIGATASYISKLERGHRPTPSRLFLLAIHSVFGVSLRWLETGEGAAFTNVIEGSRKSVTRFQTTPNPKLPHVLKCIGRLEDALRAAVQVKEMMEEDITQQCYEQIQSLADEGKETTLTNAPKTEIDDVVKSEMQHLLDKVRKLTEPRGAQSALAEFLQVPTSRVSEWLSGKCEPGGQNTLRLLQWVEQQERQH